ncbi:MAG: flagellar biosynthesis anti-sigma factor FlgM [Bacillota bacterium]|nr:flagellar biosynthesis anti-sigma factor FlgM [Bacillota bacterium]
MINKTGLNPGAIYPDSMKTERTESVKAAQNGPDKTKSAGKTDTIEISYRGDTTVKDVSKKIVDEIKKDTDPAILKDLKEKYDAGQYSVDPEEIAKSLLDNL